MRKPLTADFFLSCFCLMLLRFFSTRCFTLRSLTAEVRFLLKFPLPVKQ